MPVSLGKGPRLMASASFTAELDGFLGYAGINNVYLYQVGVLAFEAIIVVPVIRQALGLRDRPASIHFALGLTELRAFVALDDLKGLEDDLGLDRGEGVRERAGRGIEAEVFLHAARAAGNKQGDRFAELSEHFVHAICCVGRYGSIYSSATITLSASPSAGTPTATGIEEPEIDPDAPLYLDANGYAAVLKLRFTVDRVTDRLRETLRRMGYSDRLRLVKLL